MLPCGFAGDTNAVAELPASFQPFSKVHIISQMAYNHYTEHGFYLAYMLNRIRVEYKRFSLK